MAMASTPAPVQSQNTVLRWAAPTSVRCTIASPKPLGAITDARELIVTANATKPKAAGSRARDVIVKTAAPTAAGTSAFTPDQIAPRTAARDRPVRS